MSKKGRKKSAESLEAQARAHEALYGPDWHEVDEYRKQALKIIEKYNVLTNGMKMDAKELKILERRLKHFGDGTRRMKGELTFIRVLKLVEDGEAIDPGNEDEVRNYRMLERLGYIKDGILAWKGKAILKKLSE